MSSFNGSMKLSKGMIIGQGVFLAVIAAVVVMQMRPPKHPPAAAAQHGAAKADDHGPAEDGKKPGHDEEKGEAKGGHEAKGAEAKGHEAKGHEAKGAAKGGESSEGHHGTLGEDPKAIARALLAGNDRFASGNHTPYDFTGQREAAAEGQHPAAMVLGCADSRVPPEVVFDRGLGELFVVRSAGNIAEPVAVGSLEYAAEHLHAKVIVILGHDKCGAVQAALSDKKMPTENLVAIVKYISPGLKPLRGWADGPDLIRLAVEANVRRQGEELLKRSPLLRKAVAKNEIKILHAVYDIQTGRVRPL